MGLGSLPKKSTVNPLTTKSPLGRPSASNLSLIVWITVSTTATARGPFLPTSLLMFSGSIWLKNFALTLLYLTCLPCSVINSLC